jgi:predicted AlkP superfamily phosphohydrolase/phosphomutase
VDFANSTAYVRPGGERGVRINLCGREPDGTVRPSEYEATRAQLIRVLTDPETPRGDAVFARVAPREAVYEGACLDAAPDVVTVPTNASPQSDSSCSETHVGCRRDGIVAVTGGAIDQTEAIDDARLVDVAPTVLATLGVPRSDQMDGDPLAVVDPSPVATHPSVAGHPALAATIGTARPNQPVQTDDQSDGGF